MKKDESGKSLDWQVILPGLTLLLFALFGLFVVGPLLTLNKGEKGRTGAVQQATTPKATPSSGSDQAPSTEAGRLALATAKIQLHDRHPSSTFETFKVDYCAGNYAVVTFLIDGRGSAAYLVRKGNAWNIVVEGANPSETELRDKGFPESIIKYPPPCPVKPR